MKIVNALYIAAGVAGLYVAYRIVRGVTAGAESVASTAREVITQDLNPASSENIVNRGVSAVGAAVTGDEHWSLGGQLADWFSPTVRAANESLRPKPPSTPDDVIDYAALDYYMMGGTGAASGSGGVTGSW